MEEIINTPEFLAATYWQKRQALFHLDNAQLEALRRAVDDEIFSRCKPAKKRSIRRKTNQR